MSERVWRRLRWLPAVALVLMGGFASTVLSWRHGPDGCLTFMGDFDSVEQIDRSWFPPHVDCHFTYRGRAWIERQSAWEYYLPGALLVSAALCVWFATRHRDVKQPSNRPRWRQLVGVLAYWALACGTLVGLSAMVLGDEHSPRRTAPTRHSRLVPLDPSVVLDDHGLAPGR